MNTDDIQKALDFLNKDFLSYAPMIEAIEKNDASLLSVHDYGVALHHKDDIMQLAIANDEALLHYRNKISEGLLTVVYGNSDPEYIKKAIPNIARVVPCKQVVYTKKSPPKLKMEIDYRLLDESFLDFVFDNYSRAWNRDHTKKLLTNGLLWGAYVDNEIIGFVGRHSEGSMGLLEILPKFRRQGYGRELEHFIIGKVMNENRIPMHT